MKKALSMLLISVLMTMAYAAYADTAVLLWTSENINEIGEETDYVQITDYPYEGIAALDGTVVVPMEYHSLNSASLDIPGFFTVANENLTNNTALIDINNKVLTEVLYGDIKIISEDWFVGVILEQTFDADYDYKNWFGDDKYIVKRYDIYYTPSGKVGTLERGQCQNYEAFGDYLLIADTNGKVQLYDKTFTPVASNFNKYYECEYYCDRNSMTVFSRISGERIASGYISVDTLNGNCFSVRDSQYSYGIIDRQGNLILDTDYQSVSYSNMTKMIKIKQDELTGLFDPETQKIILPCEYTDIIAPDYYHMNNNGYYLVEKNGKLGYVNESNQVTCPLNYSKGAMTPVGCTMYATDMDGTYKLIAADGTITTLAGVTDISKYKNSPNGYYLVVKNEEGLWGIIDWHGNLVFDYCTTYDNHISFLGNHHFIFKNEAVYRIK